ncbi:MAG: hypothetical protein DRP71_17575 [Verrucomicrobia bacterium]|nr:MAG: hypothetical protein DRP71_17575 [Verrucomicrobiota bacterium]
MMSRFLLTAGASLLLFGANPNPVSADPIHEALVGDALLNNQGYQLLKTITTRFGPRLAGSEGNARSMDLLELKLQDLGIETRRETYSIPGWIRRDDQVTLISPVGRTLRATAVGYVDPHDTFETGLAVIASLDFASLQAEEVRGKIGLAAPNLKFSQDDYQTLAKDFGLRGVLLINRVNGGQLLARVANHAGQPAPFPIFSITVEEGRWMERQLEDGLDVQVRIETLSGCSEIEVDNLVAVLPGTSDQTIVVGGHFDSWDLGQGAMDNGLGIAQIFDTARILKTHSARNVHTIEFVWFNAEEWGLWGSRDYVERHDLTKVRAMLNLDMVGRPIAINAMGFDELVPFLQTWSENLGAWDFREKVANKTWLGSDHHPFIMKGVPTITFSAPIDSDDVRYYHDFGDTFEKVDPGMLGRATALIALLTYDLANDTESGIRNYSPRETAQLFTKAGLDKRLKKAGKWPFEENEGSDL